MLRNEGEETIDPHVSLPFQFPDLDSDWIGRPIDDPIEDLVTQIDAENADLTEVRGDDAGERFGRDSLVDVTFEPGQTRTLTHTYRTYGGAAPTSGW